MTTGALSCSASFTHSSTPSEVLFDRICRQNGIAHRLTGVRSPTTTGKIERFHRTLREEFPHEEVHPFGRSVYAHVFTRAAPDGAGD